MPRRAGPAATAKAAGLVWYPDSEPGIRRQRRGRGFTYIAPDGTTVARGPERARLEGLGVPPAYTEVWMSPRADAHLQATGRDAATRKQYRYHPDWSALRAARKFDRLEAFGRALPEVRAWVDRTLRGAPGSHDFAVATILRLIDRAAIRVGAPSNARAGVFGATTLRREHAEVGRSRIALDYVAKGGQRVRKRLTDRLLARALHASDDLPGRRLAAWRQGGEVHGVSSEAVNARLGAMAGEGVTAKTFRTWIGTLAAFETAEAARAAGEAPTVTAMSEAAAERLHNTPAVARAAYVHPGVIALADDPEGLGGLGGGPRGLEGAERRLAFFLARGVRG